MCAQRLVCTVLACLLWPLVSAGQPAVPVAILATVEGTVRIDSPGGPSGARRFTRLAAETVLHTGADGRALLVFRTGARVQVQPSSRVRLFEGRAEALDGRITSLAAVPTVPLVHPVRDAGGTITAVRIRSGALVPLTPLEGDTTLAEATELVFAPASATPHMVTVERADGSVAYDTRTTAGRVSLPRGTLQPGQSYRWRVRGATAAGFQVEGAASFTTLPEALSLERARLRAALAGTDLAHDALLAEIDLSLGLRHEALASFRRVQRAAAADPVIDERVAQLERERSVPDGKH